MSGSVSIAEINEQRVELLPERTVMSLMPLGGGPVDSGTAGNVANGATGIVASAQKTVCDLVSSVLGGTLGGLCGAAKPPTL